MANPTPPAYMVYYWSSIIGDVLGAWCLVLSAYINVELFLPVICNHVEIGKAILSYLLGLQFSNYSKLIELLHQINLSK